MGSPAQEKSHMRGVLIERLGIDPVLRDTLGKLGVRTLGEFGKLDAGGIRRRFGAAAEELYGLLHESWEVLRPREIRVPVEESMSFEWPETKSERLLAGIPSLLPGVLGVLKGRYEALEAPRIFFTLDDRRELEAAIAPAVAAAEARGGVGLIRLRLGGRYLSSGGMEVLLRGEGVEVGGGGGSG